MDATQKPNSSGYRFSVAHSLARSETVLFCSSRAARSRSRSSSFFFSGLCSMSYLADARSAAMTAKRVRVSMMDVARPGGLYSPMNVPVDVTRKARKGSVSALKDGYLLLAPMTAAVPIAVPMTPPITPPLTEAL
jgi:hypothetical protein